MISIQQQINENKQRSFVIMFLFVSFSSLAVYLISKILGYGGQGVGIAFMIAFFLSIGSYYFGDQIVLSIHKAKEADKQQEVELYRICQSLSIHAGIPMPKIYIMDDPSINAFATGRDPNHSIICVTRGLLQKLNHKETEGVIAHELSHIKNYDTRLMVITAVLVGMISILSDFFIRSLFWREDRDHQNNNFNIIILIFSVIIALISPIIATLIQMALSRRREYFADASAALLTNYPDGLALALEKISLDNKNLLSANTATSHLYIENPFKINKKDWLISLFNTHPPINERIRILYEM
jgi:heat shock protein HtpX